MKLRKTLDSIKRFSLVDGSAASGRQRLETPDRDRWVSSTGASVAIFSRILERGAPFRSRMRTASIPLCVSDAFE